MRALLRHPAQELRTRGMVNGPRVRAGDSARSATLPHLLRRSQSYVDEKSSARIAQRSDPTKFLEFPDAHRTRTFATPSAPTRQTC